MMRMVKNRVWRRYGSDKATHRCTKPFLSVDPERQVHLSVPCNVWQITKNHHRLFDTIDGFFLFLFEGRAPK